LQSPAHAFSRVLRVAALISSIAIALVLLAMYTTHVFPLPLMLACVIPFLLFQSTVALTLRARLEQMLAFVYPVSVETQVLRQGLQLLEQQSFQCTKLKEL